MKPIFSLLIPTRHRVSQLEIFLGTVADNTKNYDNIEVLIIHDDGDIITESYLHRCKKRFGFNIRILNRPQTEFLNRDYYNMMAHQANGEFMWLMGDDLVIVKKNWDIFLINKLNNFLSFHKSRVVYVRIKDDTPLPETHLPEYANFPMISKEAVEAVGYFMPPEIPSWSADYMVYLVYCHEKCNRVLTIEDTMLNHICYLTQITEDELNISGETTNRMRTIHSKYKVGEMVPVWIENTLPILRGKLRDYIENYRRQKNELISIF